MTNMQPYTIRTISEFHQFRRLPKPEHPLISLINFADMKLLKKDEPKSFVNNFYSIALKRNFNAKMKYGQQEYDFDEGIMIFIAPGQVISIEADEEIQHSGWLLLVHPDFLWNSHLANAMRQYEYFSYSVSEGLHLSEKEESTIVSIMQNIEQEYHSSIDKFSHTVIVAQLELLLTYSERFYHRQFITRRVANHQILNRLENIIEAYFNSDSLAEKGLPSVQFIADSLNVSPNYLSGLLKVLTGQSTQQHIHNKLIEAAKQKLSTTSLSVSEIAYDLGFEHSQSFSKLFKSKTSISPLEFRQSFN